MTTQAGSWRISLVLVGLTILLALPQAALLPLLDRDEPRFAEASREMLQTGHFVVPTFNFAPRYAKPPLIYWCQAASFCVFGQNAFAARLPSLLAVAGTAFVLLAWGARLGSWGMGHIACLAYAFCLQTLQQGRVATADALLIFFMTLTAFAGWRMLDLVRTGHGSWNLWGVILALGFGGGFLAKGPEALLPILPIMAGARWMGWRGMMSFVLILALGMLFVSAWAIPAYVQTHGDYWREGLGHDVGGRMVRGFQGHGASTAGWYLLTLPLYFLTFWISALPWSLIIVSRARALREAAPLDWTTRYLLGNAALIFLVFTFMVTKLPHYTLPAFPFLALLFGRCWMISEKRPGLPVELTTSFGLVAALLAFAIISLSRSLSPSPVGELVHDAGSQLSPLTGVAMVDFREPNVVWEMRRRVLAPVEEISTGDALNYLQRPGPRAIVITKKAWAALHDHSPSYLVYEAHGFNAARLKSVDLLLVLKPGPPESP